MENTKQGQTEGLETIWIQSSDIENQLDKNDINETSDIKKKIPSIYHKIITIKNNILSFVIKNNTLLPY